MKVSNHYFDKNRHIIWIIAAFLLPLHNEKDNNEIIWKEKRF